MVSGLMRISPEFKEWLKQQNEKTGLSSPQITKILSVRLRGTDVIETKKPKKRRKNSFTLTEFFDTDIGDIGKWL